MQQTQFVSVHWPNSDGADDRRWNRAIAIKALGWPRVIRSFMYRGYLAAFFVFFGLQASVNKDWSRAWIGPLWAVGITVDLLVLYMVMYTCRAWTRRGELFSNSVQADLLYRLRCTDGEAHRTRPRLVHWRS
jgi:hypothetical protein